MLFPNKIWQCILLILIGAAFSFLGIIFCTGLREDVLSLLLFALVVFGIPLIINIRNKLHIQISFTGFVLTFKKTKYIHLVLFIYLLLTAIAKSIFIGNTGGMVTFTFLLSIFAGSVIEEFIFRFTILNGLLERYSVIKANLITSSIFALMHFNVVNGYIVNYFNVINAFVLSYLFGLIFIYNKNIIYLAILHCLVNFLIIELNSHIL